MWGSSDQRKIVVVGAGIVGSAVAYFLARRGMDVTVIDSRSPSAGATGSSDGAVSVASKQPGMMMGLAQTARAFYGELEHNGLFAGLYQKRPTFLIARSEEEMGLLEMHADDLATAGERIEVAGYDRLRSLMPGLSEAAFGGVVVLDDGHALGYQIAERLLTRSRVAIIRDCTCEALTLRAEKTTGIRTTRGHIPADIVVIAAGLGSARLCGLESVLFPRKGQIVITDRGTIGGAAFDGHLMAASYIAAKRRGSKSAPSPIGLVIDPLLTGQFLIGGTREDNRSDTGTDIMSIAGIVREAAELYPPLMARRVIRTFSGIRTATRDGLPVAGYHPSIHNLVLATGFEGDGICLGPYAGRVIADMVIGKPANPEFAPLDPSRFLPAGAKS